CSACMSACCWTRYTRTTTCRSGGSARCRLSPPTGRNCSTILRGPPTSHPLSITFSSCSLSLLVLSPSALICVHLWLPFSSHAKMLPTHENCRNCAEATNDENYARKTKGHEGSLGSARHNRGRCHGPARLAQKCHCQGKGNRQEGRLRENARGI